MNEKKFTVHIEFFVFFEFQLIGMIYKLHKEGAGEESLLHVCDVDHTCSETERRHHVSVNTVKWIPQPGRGLVYGTNRGDLRICSPS